MFDPRQSESDLPRPRPVVSWAGGKGRLLKHLLPLLRPHTAYGDHRAGYQKKHIVHVTIFVVSFRWLNAERRAGDSASSAPSALKVQRSALDVGSSAAATGGAA